MSVTTSSVITELTASSFGDVAGAATGTGRRFTDLIGRTFASLLASTSSSPVSTAAGVADLVVVTPFGADGLGVTTAAAVAGHRGRSMRSCRRVTSSAPSSSTRDGVAIVELADGADTTTGPTLTKFADDWTVVAFRPRSAPAKTTSCARSGCPKRRRSSTPTATSSGCTIGPNGVEMLPVETLPDADPPCRRRDRAAGCRDDRVDRAERVDRYDGQRSPRRAPSPRCRERRRPRRRRRRPPRRRRGARTCRRASPRGGRLVRAADELAALTLRWVWAVPRNPGSGRCPKGRGKSRSGRRPDVRAIAADAARRELRAMPRR